MSILVLIFFSSAILFTNGIEWEYINARPITQDILECTTAWKPWSWNNELGKCEQLEQGCGFYEEESCNQAGAEYCTGNGSVIVEEYEETPYTISWIPKLQKCRLQLKVQDGSYKVDFEKLMLDEYICNTVGNMVCLRIF